MSEISKDYPNELPVPKIYKFDKAIVMGYDDTTYGIYGDMRFRAPEVIMGRPYSFKADSWSFGVILFYLLTNEYPFDNK